MLRTTPQKGVFIFFFREGILGNNWHQFIKLQQVLMFSTNFMQIRYIFIKIGKKYNEFETNVAEIHKILFLAMPQTHV